MLRRALVMACVLLPMGSVAEIEKNSVVSQGGLHLMWWPKVTAPEGWHLDKGASQANGINVVVPDGANFSNAETVIYGRALYKPRDPGVKSLQALIERDQAGFRKNSPALEIKATASLAIADGTAMQAFTYFPGADGKGNWECVVYAEDGDYYLMFVVSARSQKGFDAARVAYEKVVASYTREPQAGPAPK
jgi:hypothetical protein